MMKYKNDLEPFANGWLSAEIDNNEWRMACGMYEEALKMPISIEPWQMFAGYHIRRANENSRGSWYDFGSGVMFRQDLYEKKIAENPQFADELTEMMNEMAKVQTTEIFHQSESEYEKRLCNMKVGWGGGHNSWVSGHSNPDFGLLVKIGTDGMREKIEQFRAKNPGKDLFYDSLKKSIDAIDVLAQRYRVLAEEMAEQAEGDEKARYLRMAAALKKVPKNTPDDFYEACQLFWIIFCFDGIDSPGRFDQYMIEYYRRSEEKDRVECLEGLWQLFKAVRAWNLCISGSDAEWNDETNELSYAILECARKYKYNTPNITMRVHRNTPDALWKSAAETIATGIGMPALYNDECVCPALEALGIPTGDAHEYCMNGCNQIDIFGKSHMGLEDGEVCFAKCLELTLNNGVCPVCNEKISLETGDPTEFATYEEFFAAYKKQIEHVCDLVTDLSNRSQKLCAEMAPNPYRSTLIEGCMEKGVDYAAGGPLYGHGQILIEGFADAVDSLAAIKHFVYDEKKYTMAELVDALKKNFEGYDQLYRDFSGFEKFGNDCPYVDAIYKEVFDHFYAYLLKIPTFRGGVFGAGCSTFQRAAAYGEKIGALPNGKKKESSLLADSIGATPGCDKKGPTALLKSLMGVDQTMAKSGNVLQMKFNKSIFATEAGMNAFLNLAKTYFQKKGQQLSINVVSHEELLDAQKHPEKYGNLIVRVGGYSDYFVNLSAGLQENVIQRSKLF